MLESFAAWIVNTYIGDYFGNVNTDQLRMSIHNGEIELERLPLKRDILKNFGLPLEAKTGYIGKISIKFPRWALFSSEPLVITVDELYLLVKPVTNFSYNEEEETKTQQEFKIVQLDTLESRWKALHEDIASQSSYYSSSYSSWLNYGSSFFSNILLNIHLKISSVHIRYEDQSTIPGCPFATGIVLRSLFLSSTDENWQKKYVTRDNLLDKNLVYKLIELESFSVYFDTDTKLFDDNGEKFYDKEDLQRLVESMRNNFEHNHTQSTGQFVEHEYIIAPVNGKCFLKRNCSELSLKKCNEPRTIIDVQLEQVPVVMTAIQYKHLLDWSMAFNNMKTIWRYRKWRPMILNRRISSLSSSQDNLNSNNKSGCRDGFVAKTWWHFAVNANLEEYRQRKQRFNWHFIIQRSRDIVAYHEAYLHYLVYQELFTKEMRIVKDRCENEFTLDEVCSIRELVFAQADKILREQRQAHTMLTQTVQPETLPNGGQVEQSSTGTWYLPHLISNLYYNYSISVPQDSQNELANDDIESQKNAGDVCDVQDENDVPMYYQKKHRRTMSTSSNASLTEDIFLLRDAVFCQFNFQIKNSSFQLIAFNVENDSDSGDKTADNDPERSNSGNLLLAFEFHHMKIGFGITNPNAYSCVCHMNQGYRRRQQYHLNNSNDHQANINIGSKQILTQNELNQLQFNLNFKCQNLSLQLLRTDQAIINERDAQKLATAQLSGGGLSFVFSQSHIAIDGRLDSLEILDLVTEPEINKHRKVLSIGLTDHNDDVCIDFNEDQQSPRTAIPNPASKNYSKALAFSLSREFSQNLLKLDIHMASFTYVHSAILVHELALCRDCFSDVLEAYFSRSFKEKVKAATTEMLRGIVKSPLDNSSSTSGTSTATATTAAASNVIESLSEQSRSVPNSPAISLKQKQNLMKNHMRKKSKTSSPFIDNFKLEISISSPVIIFPLSASSSEVVVFHLGNMSLKNRNPSVDFYHLKNVSRKYSPNSNSGSLSSYDSYNAEIHDLSVYSLDCQRNIIDSSREYSMQELYFCDNFGVPILQKTVIQIVLEKKIFYSSMYCSDGHSAANRKSQMNRGSVSPQMSKKLSASSVNSQDEAFHTDGLNLIGNVNSIDPLVPPKKFSILSHLQPDNFLNREFLPKKSQSGQLIKPELVLSIDISSINVRFSYNDLLIFIHIANSLLPKDRPASNIKLDDDDDIEELCREIQKNRPANDSSSVEPEEFKLRLDKLQDLGFDYGDSINALAQTGGDVIEAAFMLSNSENKTTDVQSESLISSEDNESLTTERSKKSNTMATSITSNTSTINSSSGLRSASGKLKKSQNDTNFFSSLSVIEVRIGYGSVRVIDDCNQLDIPLIELGIDEFRFLRQNNNQFVEAFVQTNFFLDYYNSHLSGWEPFIEHCQVSLSWKMHKLRCHLKSMMGNQSTFANYHSQPSKQKLALKIEVKKMFNLNVSRTLLDLIERVRSTWINEIVDFTETSQQNPGFRQRKPFIPFVLRNETGSNLQVLMHGNRQIFSTAKAADLITHCDLKTKLDIKNGEELSFDLVDRELNNMDVNQYRGETRKFSKNAQQKIVIKVDGWSETFPLSIEREGTFIRHIVSSKFHNQSAILVFEVGLRENAVKLIKVRSSLIVTNRTTKNVELNFANTDICTVKTSYIIAANGSFPVPLELLYARMQLRPCDLGLGACRTPINWNQVRKFGEQHCSLQICTPITHTSQTSYSNSLPYVVTVLVERNSIGSLIENQKRLYSSLQNSSGVYSQIPLGTIPSHVITLLPPLQLSNRLPYEVKFVVHEPKTSGSMKSGEDYSVHYVDPLKTFMIEFTMEQFGRTKPLVIQPGATKDYTASIELYDSKGRTLVLKALISIVCGKQQPCQALTITLYAPYWIINRSGLPLIFGQEGVYLPAAGQDSDHERARSISPLLFSYAEPEQPHYCTMRLGKMSDSLEPRWCNFFLLEKGTFYRRLRVSERVSTSRHSSFNLNYDPNLNSPAKSKTRLSEKIYEFGIDIRNGRDRYSNTKIVTVAPRYQIENLTSYKLEFAQKCLVDYWNYQNEGSKTLNSNNAISRYQHERTFDYTLSSPSKNSRGRFSFSETVENYFDGSVTTATTIISALPKSNTPYHWPCSDMPKMLCVRIGSFENCLWSGSFSVGTEPSVSFHLNVRDDSGRSYFIRVEILLQNATYFIVFTDANSLPPPIRIENFSQVPIEFFQTETTNVLLRTRVRPNSSVPYALDEPSLPSYLTVCAPGGDSSVYDLNSFASGDDLTYDNFYYLAFGETFSGYHLNSFSSYLPGDIDDDEQWMLMMLHDSELSNLTSDFSVGSQMLVLDVPDECSFSNKPKLPVALQRKERGKRSQLWKIEHDGKIIHEGSSPPTEPGIQDIGLAQVRFSKMTHGQTHLMVLDVDDDLGARLAGYLPLCIRRMDPTRRMTQTWLFTEDGRLRCLQYSNYFVQPMPDLNSTVDKESACLFKQGQRACLYLGPLEKYTNQPAEESIQEIPREQNILKQKLRKGSGRLNVSILADGPSRVLRIKDQQMSANGRQLQLAQYNSLGTPLSMGQFGIERTRANDADSFLVKILKQTELELNFHIDSIGISLVNAKNEELVYLFLQKILLEATLNPAECELRCSVQNIQADNQLFYCEKEVILYLGDSYNTSPTEHQDSMTLSQALVSRQSPAITFNLHKLFIPNVDTNVFKSLQVSINDLVINIEEIVLLKLLELIRYNPVDNEMDEISSSKSSTSNEHALYQANRHISSTLSQSTQFYFAYLLIHLSQVKLSVFTSAQRLTSFLYDLKKKAGITLIRFEDAMIMLKPFKKVYSLMTKKFLMESVKEHYRTELKNQAAKILGSVDFLGNPVGFWNDLNEGFNDLIGGNVAGLISSVTHGFSDSTAKFTSALSESLGTLTMDARYQEIRRKIKHESTIEGQRSHLSAGAVGLVHGIVGGITSVITQTYDGVVNQGGVGGLISGFGRGVLGTFTKPTMGLLDFASSAATAVRDSSKKWTYSNGKPLRRIRLPRTLTIDGRLTTFDPIQSTWQSRFCSTNDFGSREFGEQFVHVFMLSNPHFLLLTTQRLFFFHSTLTKNEIPDSSTDFMLEDHLEFPDNLGAKIMNCQISQLSVIPLEQLLDCEHYQMRALDAQHFVRQQGAQQTCLNFADMPNESLCNCVEYRSIMNSSGQHRQQSYAQIAQAGNTALPHTNLSHVARVQSIEYPKGLSLCYVFCDNSNVASKIVHFVNEAKHLQEERKFQVCSTFGDE